MNNIEFVDKLKNVLNYKTLYVMGCFGAPLTAANKKRYSSNNDYNRGRKDIINAASEDTFGFDCVCLIKGLLWGWNGNKNAVYGGAKYGSNGVPDIGTESIIQVSNPSTDFNKIVKGAIVWMQGHVGIYIGENKVIECSPKWENGVQVTTLQNLAGKTSNSRLWTKWGKLPYIDYIDETPKISILFNGVITQVCAINIDNTNYIRLRDLEDVLKLGIVDWNSQRGLPEIKTNQTGR